MTPLAALWLPVVVSAVLVFAASSVLHMAPLWHRKDYPPVPGEERVREALRPLAIPPGDYMVPRTLDPVEMKSPEFQEKMRQGPNVILTVMPPGTWEMGRTLGQWFAYTLVVSVFAAYVAGAALPPGADYLSVFRFAGVATFLSYAVGVWPLSIWFRRAWSQTLKETVDGAIYALLVAGVFGWLWPG